MFRVDDMYANIYSIETYSILVFLWDSFDVVVDMHVTLRMWSFNILILTSLLKGPHPLPFPEKNSL